MSDPRCPKCNYHVPCDKHASLPAFEPMQPLHHDRALGDKLLAEYYSHYCAIVTYYNGYVFVTVPDGYLRSHSEATAVMNKRREQYIAQGFIPVFAAVFGVEAGTDKLVMLGSRIS